MHTATSLASLQPPVPDGLMRDIESIAREDASLHAWVHLAPPFRATALQAHSDVGVAGKVFGVKDVLDVEGMPTRCGSELTSHLPAHRDAACVAMLRQAGAVPIGKTATAEFAYRVAPSTRNPISAGHTPGGSSSGSAAAVAAGMVPFALSTQTGASIIRPAAYCAAFGFKPSFGSISRAGLAPGSESLDTIGWHAESLDMIGRVAKILLPQSATPSQAGNRLRVATLDRFCGIETDEATASNLNRVGEHLRSAGFRLASLDASAVLESLLEAHNVILCYESARSIGPIVASHQRVSGPVAELLRRGFAIQAPQYIAMRKLQERYRSRWDEIAGDADVLMTLSAPTLAPAGLEDTGSSIFSRVWTLLGWPSLHLPIGRAADGRATGVQLVGPWLCDSNLLQAADLVWSACASTQEVSSFH